MGVFGDADVCGFVGTVVGTLECERIGGEGLIEPSALGGVGDGAARPCFSGVEVCSAVGFPSPDGGIGMIGLEEDCDAAAGNVVAVVGVVL